jgi:hypothetical protein
VIGNPPYVDMREIIKDNIVYYKKNYISSSNRINLFAIFIELALRIIKTNGDYGMIIHRNPIRSNEYENCRKLILENTTINNILSFKIGVFEDVTGEMMVLTFNKISPKDDSIVNIYQFNKSIDSQIQPNQISQDIFKKSIGHRLNIYLNDNVVKLLNKIISRTLPLKEISYTLQGIIAGDEKKYIVDNKLNSMYMPILRGKDISKYYLPNSAKEFIYFVEGTKILIRSRKRENFEVDKKILTQHVSGRIVATLDDKKYYYMQTINGTIITDNNFLPEYIVALLNSALINFYYDFSFNLGAEFTTAVAIENIDLLPIMLTTLEVQQNISDIVNQILALKQSDPSTDTTALEREIDLLVYKLYDLTDEEIKIVEGR